MTTNMICRFDFELQVLKDNLKLSIKLLTLFIGNFQETLYELEFLANLLKIFNLDLRRYYKKFYPFVYYKDKGKSHWAYDQVVWHIHIVLSKESGQIYIQSCK